MVKKKVLAMTLLTTIGLASNPILSEEARADEKINNNGSKKEEKTEEKKELSEKEIEELNLNETEEKDIESNNKNIKEEALEKKEENKSTKQLKKGKVVNITTYLNIRAKAATNSEVKGTLKVGEIFDIEGKEGSWYKISYKGIKGYVHSDYVKETTENSSSNNSGNSNNNLNNNNTNINKIGQVVNVTSSLRIREKASTSSAILGSLKANEKVDIINESNGWYKIKKGAITGYVSNSYIKIINNGSGNNSSGSNSGNNNGNTSGGNTSSGDTAVKEKGQVVNVSSSLRIRSEANTSSTILGHLKAKEKVDVISKSNGWYKIKKGNIIGYVSSNYIKLVSDGSGNNSGESNSGNNGSSNGNTNSNLTIYVKAKEGKLHNVSTNLRMRSNPSTTANVVSYLLPTDKILIEGESGSWYYISANGKKGYAHKDYIREGSSSSGGSSGNGSNQNNSSKYNQVLSIMKAQIGSPYIFGGNGDIITTSLLNSLKKAYPTSNYNISSQYLNGKYRAFDCSGLMRWSFGQIGINLGRTTYNQINNGYEVSLGSIKPGDLLFYSDLNHVGMYIGGDQWLESPRSGEYVRIATVPWKKIGRARRVL